MALHKVSNGDLRQAITLLQSAKLLAGSNPMTEDLIFELTGTITVSLMDRVMFTWAGGNIDQIQTTLKQVLGMGYSGNQVLNQVRVY